MSDAHDTTAGTDAAEPLRGRWLGLVALTLGVTLIIVDSTIVNVAIPSIVRDLDIPLTTAQWANTIYSLVFASLLIGCGRAGDIVGRRKMFVGGVIVFLLASLLAGAAQSSAELLLARLLQGIGGAIILPSTLSSVNAMFHGRERAMAFGVWGAVIGGAVALGPLLGGWFTTNMSWRWAFFINVPVGIIAILIVLRCVPETRQEGGDRSWDIPGTLALSGGLAMVVFATIEGNMYGWWAQRAPFVVGDWTWPPAWPSIIAVAYGVGVLLLVIFHLVEQRRRRRGRSVLLDPELFRLASFRNGSLAAMIVSLGELGLVFVLPLYLQTVLGYSAWDTGLLLVALSGGAFLAGGAAAPLTQRIGARRVVSAGLALEVVAIATLGAVISTSVTWQVMAPLLFVYGLGVGLATAQLTSVILRDVPARISGLASGVQSTARQVGAALGIAILGSVFVLLLITGSADRLDRVDGLSDPRREKIQRGIERTGGAVVPGLGDDDVGRAAARAVDESIVTAAQWTAWIAAGFVLIGLWASLRLPESIEERDRRLARERRGAAATSTAAR